MLTLKSSPSYIAKIEGKKSQARVGDLREVQKIYIDEHAKYLAGVEGAESPMLPMIEAAEKKAAKLIAKMKKK